MNTIREDPKTKSVVTKAITETPVVQLEQSSIQTLEVKSYLYMLEKQCKFDEVFLFVDNQKVKNFGF